MTESFFGATEEIAKELLDNSGYGGRREKDMEGIRFLTDEKGRKVAVQLDLDRYGEVWEDIHDRLVAASRDHEKSIPFDVVKRRLVRKATRG